MKLLIATIPDEAELLPAWLERHIVSPNLAEVVAELTAIHGSHPPPLAARQILGEALPAVLVRGLSDLSQTTLRTFLRNPTLLLELQEIVLTEGGSYWDNLVTDHEIDRVLDRTERRLQAALGLAEPLPEAKHAQLRFYRRPWVVGFATAAAVLIGVYFSRSLLEDWGRWGWQRPGVLTRGVTASAYLGGLADAAAEYRSRPKEDPESLRRALWEMRDGCTHVIASEHRQLTEPDRIWLVGKCRDWGMTLDQHLVDLQSGKDWQAVRTASEETVDRLVKALRERAQQTDKT